MWSCNNVEKFGQGGASAMAGNKMKTSQEGRNCQKLDGLPCTLNTIQDGLNTRQGGMALVDIAVAVAKLAVLGGSTALEAPGHMRQ